MEFNEKLQNLRKQKGITQEELAEELFVSRTAISKWESGRGYPSIDSLKGISDFFDVTVDELLSSEEIMIIAQEDSDNKSSKIKDLIFGMLDICNILLLFLPVFAERNTAVIRSVSLMVLTDISLYLKIIYFVFVTFSIVLGVATLALQNCEHSFWLKSKGKISLIMGAAGAIIFTITLQPYAATFFFVFLLIKVFLFLKKQ